MSDNPIDQDELLAEVTELTVRYVRDGSPTMEQFGEVLPSIAGIARARIAHRALVAASGSLSPKEQFLLARQVFEASVIAAARDMTDRQVSRMAEALRPFGSEEPEGQVEARRPALLEQNHAMLSAMFAVSH